MSELVSGQVPTLSLDSSMVSPLRLHWVKDVCMFRRKLLPALLAEWPESFTCHCGKTGVEQTPNKSSTHSWLWRRKFSHRFCWDLNSQPFDHESGALTSELSWLLAYLWGMCNTRPPPPELLSFSRDCQPAVGCRSRDGSLSASTWSTDINSNSTGVTLISYLIG